MGSRSLVRAGRQAVNRALKAVDDEFENPEFSKVNRPKPIDVHPRYGELSRDRRGRQKGDRDAGPRQEYQKPPSSSTGASSTRLPRR